MVREIREGLDVVWHNRTLRALAWSIGLWQLFRHAFVAIVVLFGARELGFSAGQVGLLFMAAGLGSLMAASVTTRLNARFGMGPTMLGGIAGCGIAWLVIAAATGPHWLAGVLIGRGPVPARPRGDDLLHQLPVPAPGRHARPRCWDA